MCFSDTALLIITCIPYYSAKLKAQKQQSVLGEGQEEEERGGGGNFLEQLKRKRDYRRRRQTYRAKNVHITRKTPREASQHDTCVVMGLNYGMHDRHVYLLSSYYNQTALC